MLNGGCIFLIGDMFIITKRVTDLQLLVLEMITPEVVMQKKRNEFLKNLGKQACSS